MLRDAVKKRTPEGLRAQSVIDQGQLVPDEIVCSIVEARVQEPDCRGGFILDGFPRTLAQARFLDRLLAADGRWCPLVLNIRVDRELLIKRAAGRRTCSVCGEIYNVYFKPPKEEGICDLDGGALIHRSDDNEETIRQRQAAYESQTKPLIDYYDGRSLLRRFDGSRTPSEVHDHIRATLATLRLEEQL